MPRTKGSTSKVKTNKNKISKAEKDKLEILDIYCRYCGKTKRQNPNGNMNFFSSDSEFWSVDGYLPICKDHMREIFLKIYLGEACGNIRDAFYIVCMRFDLPYNERFIQVAVDKFNDYDDVEKFISSEFGKYIGNAQSFGKKSGDTANFDYASVAMKHRTKHEIETGVPDVPLELCEKYGYGFEPLEYLNFERKYKKLEVGYSQKTSLHTERLITYIIHKVKEEMATANGHVNEAEKWAKLAQKDATDAKLNVSQLSKSDITGGIDVLPQLIEAVEEKVSLIPIMPKLKAIPYDDVDMTIYALVNYYRRLEDKPMVEYKDVWSFYDTMFYNELKEQGLSDEEINTEKAKRNNTFKDLGEVYYEPLYKDHHSEEGDD